MKNLFLFFTVCFLAFNCAAYNTSKYYFHIHHAENQILQNNYKIAINYYEKGFQFANQKPFHYDIKNALNCCIRIKLYNNFYHQLLVYLLEEDYTKEEILDFVKNNPSTDSIQIKKTISRIIEDKDYKLTPIKEKVFCEKLLEIDQNTNKYLREIDAVYSTKKCIDSFNTTNNFLIGMIIDSLINENLFNEKSCGKYFKEIKVIFTHHAQMNYNNLKIVNYLCSETEKLNYSIRDFESYIMMLSESNPTLNIKFNNKSINLITEITNFDIVYNDEDSIFFDYGLKTFPNFKCNLKRKQFKYFYNLEEKKQKIIFQGLHPEFNFCSLFLFPVTLQERKDKKYLNRFEYIYKEIR
jgi:hypothetical protein